MPMPQQQNRMRRVNLKTPDLRVWRSGVGTAIKTAGTRLIKSGSVKPRYQISDLCIHLESYLEPKQVQEVYRAYLMSAEAHEGQKRLSGEPYIYHPVAVARILADMRMDSQCLVAAILHDVIEDTHATPEEVRDLFGDDVFNIVSGVTKISALPLGSSQERQA